MQASAYHRIHRRHVRCDQLFELIQGNPYSESLLLLGA
jgi:hypothetical protein